MALCIITHHEFYGSSITSGQTDSFTNAEVLRKLTADSNGNLFFNGKKVGEKALEVSYSAALTEQIISQGFIALPHDCDTSRTITLTLQGISFLQGQDWEVNEQTYPQPDLITWKDLGLEAIARVSDNISITYYKKS